MKRAAILVVVLAFGFCSVWAQNSKAAPEKKIKAVDRVDAAQKVLNEIMAAPDKSIPAKILTTADCIAVIPSMLKVGFGFGGRYGKGIATCRTSDDHWSAPAPIRTEGGSWGLQFGGQAVDVVMVFANRDGLDQLLTSKFKIGGDAGAAAGPVGRDAEVATDWKMRTKILTYSRSRGVFAGVDLNGTAVKQDTDDTLALYGNKFVPYDQILSGRVTAPPETRPFITEVAKYFREAKAGEVVANKKAAPSGTKEKATQGTAGSAGGVAGTAAAAQPANRGTETGQGTVAAPTGESQTTTTSETTNTSKTQEEVGSPTEVKSKIEDSFRNTPNFDASNVKIDVTDDAVVLSGAVPSDSAKRTAKRVAQQNAGGRKVIDDNLTVK